MSNLIIQLVKKDDILKYKFSSGDSLYKTFKDTIKEDQIVEMSLELIDNSGSIAQIRKIHKLFRIISEHSGYTVEEVKLLVKEECGFAYNKIIDNKYYVIPIKSIADMSKDELIKLIECTIMFASNHYQLTID